MNAEEHTGRCEDWEEAATFEERGWRMTSSPSGTVPRQWEAFWRSKSSFVRRRKRGGETYMPKTIFPIRDFRCSAFLLGSCTLHLELLFMLCSQTRETTPRGFTSAETQPDLLLADYQRHPEPCFSLWACLSRRHSPMSRSAYHVHEGSETSTMNVQRHCAKRIFICASRDRAPTFWKFWRVSKFRDKEHKTFCCHWAAKQRKPRYCRTSSLVCKNVNTIAS